MGGSKVLDVPSNIITLCSFYNGLIESDSGAARRAREMGWKLSPGQIPRRTPIWLFSHNDWAILDDEFNVVIEQSGRASPDSNIRF